MTEVFWKPIEKEFRLDVESPKSFIQIMSRLKGTRGPWLLTKEDIPFIKGAIAAGRQDLDDILDMIARFERISIWFSEEDEE